MGNTFKYSFVDEVADKFCYDNVNKIIEIHFSGYTDLDNNERLLDAPCTFTIRNWIKAKCTVGDEKKLYDLDLKMGIVDMILSMEIIENNLKILVSTLDGRYLTITFNEADINFISLAGTNVTLVTNPKLK